MSETGVPSQFDGSEIAIVGLAGRFPGAPNVDAFWQNLRDGVESITPLSDEQLRAAGVSAAVLARPEYVRSAAVLEGAEWFDAAFFGCSPREAEILDPQQRLFLECAWEAFEHAGYDPATFDGSVGVFAGAGRSSYFEHNLRSHPELMGTSGGYEAVLGNESDFLATRVAYKLNLKGPSLSIQTSCSTSLVAAHVACQHLLMQQCDMALAGGVFTGRLPATGYLWQPGAILSPDGHCRAFDARAQGTVAGRGVGIVVLKRLADALRDGDTVHAVIRGSAVNNDGSAKVSYTAPSVAGQAEVIAEAMAVAGVRADSIGLVEAHGTGTALGDPAEVAALTKVYRAQTDRTGFCAIGSLKTNIGHLDVAAGVTGLIKATMALRHRQLPPSLHFESANPEIHFEETPFYVNARLRPWESNGQPRRAAVSSFGIGGTNAHVVLEEAPGPAPRSASAAPQALVLSARTRTALDAATSHLADFFARYPDSNLADVAYTLQVGRRAFEHRRIAVCRNAADAAAVLGRGDAARAFTTVAATPSPSCVLMFPSLDEAAPLPIAELYEEEPAFREIFDRCVERAASLVDVDLHDVRLSREARGNRAVDHAALFAAQFALARVLEIAGLRPSIVAGAGVGELAAACVAGMISLDEALQLAAGAQVSVDARAGRVPVLSSRTGGRLTESDFTAARCWTEKAGAPAAGGEMGALLGGDAHVIVEAGRGDAFAGWLRQGIGGPGRAVIGLLTTGTVVRSPRESLTEALGRAWIAGCDIDWVARHGVNRPRRTPLPTYPFERQRFFVEPQASTPIAAQPQKPGKLPDVGEWFHRPTWKQAPPLSISTMPAADRSWLLLLDASGVGDALAAALRARGDRVIEVRPGEAFQRFDDERFVVEATRAEDYGRLLHAVTAAGVPTFEIVHLWSIDEERESGVEARVSAALDRGFYSLLALAQAFARNGSSRSWRLHVVSAGAHAVTGDETLRPVCAAMVGACRVIPQELPNLACAHVDIALARGATLSRGQAELLLQEISMPSAAPTVAHRGVTRWVQAFEPVRVDSSGEPVRLRDRGCYLVTGGTGGIGLTIAEYLAERVRARLVLVARTAVPPREEWAAMLDASADDRATRTIRRIQALERLGGEVVVETGDVASVEDMTRIVTAARARFGRIDGVVHAAGVAGGGLIPLKTRDAAARVLRAKVLGTLVLDEVLRGDTIDFFVLCSSLQGVIGGVGQVDYCAASAVLDAYAQARWSAGDRSVVAIDWDAWQEVGMAVETAVPDAMRDQRRQNLLHAILPSEGKTAFACALAAGLPRVAIYTQDFDAVAAAASGRAPLAQPVVEEAPRGTRHPRPALATRLIAPRTPLEQGMCDVFEQVLGFEQLGVDDNFFELGGHSLLIVDLVSRLKRRHDVDLPIARLYEGETLSPAFVATLVEEITGIRSPASLAARAAVRHEPLAPPRMIERPEVTHSSQEVKVMRGTRSVDRVDRSAIAIVGMSARFPGAPNVDAYWRNLRDGVDSRHEFTDDELRATGVPSSALRHPKLVKAGFVLEDIDKFDAGFFGINPREAELLDPQHRLFLECAWHARENAGYDGDTFDGAIAVFGGATMSGYLNSNIYRNADVWKSVGARQAIYGSVPDYMVTRVSYKLNLKGPCYFVQTACSTSLVAVHLGCQSLQNHECDMVLAGGVSVQVPHMMGYVYEEGGMMSPDGTCRTFDASARGTVFGSGVGLVALKRLEEAIADGDTIHAVIRGTATNNDGSLKVGFTAPSVVGQAQVIAEAMANAGVSADSISYVEAHGTGTELGDPIEVAALSRAYRAHTDRRSYCALGSVKPNIGHLDAAAGVSSLIKTVLGLEHGQMPPTIHFERPNPKIDFENSPFFVNTTLTPWIANGGPRRAGVSSFGFGGTNAHVVLEEAPPVEASGPSRSQQLLVLSAKTETALDAAAAALAEHLRRSPNANLADVAYTLQVGRRPFGYRRAIGCSTREEAIDALEGGDVRRVSNGLAASKDRTAVFLFPGQGAQYVGMGAGLYAEEPTFRGIVDECCEQLKEPLDLDLRELLYPKEGSSAELSDRLKQTSNTQAALFVVEYALAKLWMSWGVTPSACIGHSIGEFVAACLSGVLTLPDALRLVALRGKLMEAMQAGVMAAVPLPENRVQPLLTEGLWLAAINGPSLCVVSGERDRVAAFVARLAADGVECRLLHTSHAFHSGMMEPAVAPFVAAVREMTLGAPSIPYISNITGDWITEAQVRQPEYWGRHIREAVRFADGVGQLLKQSDRLFLEIGPGATLSSLVRQQSKGGGGHVIVSSLRGPQEQTPDAMTISAALGRLWVTGAAVDWRGVHAFEQRRRVPLPGYPFERQRYWISADKFNPIRAKRMIAAVDRPFSQWFQVPSWTRALPRPAVPVSMPIAEACLVFLDECGVGDAVAIRFERLGYTVVRVRAGESFAQTGDKTFTIGPASRADYSALLKALRTAGNLPATIAHCWGVTRRADPMPDRESIRGYEARGFYSLLFLAQALGELGLTAPLRLGVVADGTQDVTGLETLVPEKASAFGPVRVIPKEFANISSRAIDLPLEPAELSEPTLDLLVGDLLAPINDREVAYRHGRRWTSCYASAHLVAADEQPARLKQGGVYLLTGGLGGISLVFARHLAESLHAKLVLTGRRGLPPREMWTDHLAQYGESDATSRRIRVVQELEAAGADVLVGEADAADEGQMRAVVEAACARFGRIDGVVHAAGLPGAGMIQLKKPEAAAGVLAPKVDGARVLARIFHDRPLDFMLLCSSTTSVLGLVGQVDYCAANAYLDTFAHQYAAATGTFTVSINWSAWREVGMAVDTQNLRENTGDQMLEAGLSNADGIDAFRRILSHAGDHQVAVTPFELKLLLEADRDEADEATAEKPRETAASAGTASSASASTPTHHPRPNLQSVYVAARTDAEKKICRLWQEMLGIEPVGVHDNFFDLGGHSLLAVRVMTRVNEALGTEIPVAKLYEGLTVSFLAGLIAQDPLAAPPDDEGDAEMAERRREKAKRQREHQQRRRVVLGR